MSAADPLAGTPFFTFGRRPFREDRLAAYIHREHQRGRHVGEILDDPYVQRCGGGVLHAVLRRRDLIVALERDVAEAIRTAGPS